MNHTLSKYRFASGGDPLSPICIRDPMLSLHLGARNVHVGDRHAVAFVEKILNQFVVRNGLVAFTNIEVDLSIAIW